MVLQAGDDLTSSAAAITALEAAARAAIESIGDELVAWRRHFHAHPELSFEEVGTTRRLCQMLSEWGVPHRVMPRGVGVIAELRRAADDPPTVLLRADIDALAIEEQNDVPYRSRNPGVMHACGHDAHMTCLLGAVRGLLAVRDQLRGNVRFVFQPGEEVVPGGALDAIEAGALDGVRSAYALHVAPEYPVGKIAIRSGAMTASADRFDVAIHGRSGHGARPHEAIDPIFVGTQVVSALYHGMRRFDPREAAVLSVGRFQGGHSANVIPELAELSGTFRSTDAATRKALREMIERTINDVCHLHGARAELVLSHGPPAVINDERCTSLVEQAAARALGEANVVRIARPSMGSEDFAEFLAQRPGAMFRLGVGSERCSFGLHSARFDIEERALPIGASLLAACALRELAQ